MNVVRHKSDAAGGDMVVHVLHRDNDVCTDVKTMYGQSFGNLRQESCFGGERGGACECTCDCVSEELVRRECAVPG